MTPLLKNSGRPKSPYEDQFIKDWKIIQKKLKEAHTQRSKIAHGSVISPQPVMDGIVKKMPVWVPFYERNSYKMYNLLSDINIFEKKYEELSANDVKQICKKFLSCQNFISNLIDYRFPNANRN